MVGVGCMPWTAGRRSWGIFLEHAWAEYTRCIRLAHWVALTKVVYVFCLFASSQVDEFGHDGGRDGVPKRLHVLISGPPVKNPLRQETIARDWNRKPAEPGRDTSRFK